jgi:hypothetical protein
MVQVTAILAMTMRMVSIMAKAKESMDATAVDDGSGEQ